MYPPSRQPNSFYPSNFNTQITSPVSKDSANIEDTSQSRPMPASEVPVNKTISSSTIRRPLPVPSMLGNSSTSLPTNQPIRTTTNVVVNTPPPRPALTSYDQIVKVSNSPKVALNTPPPRPTHNSYEQLPDVPNAVGKRVVSPLDGPVENGSTTKDDQPTRFNRISSTVKSKVSSNIPKLRNSSSEVKRNDSLSEKANRSPIVQQPPAAFTKVFPYLAQCDGLQNFSSVQEVESYIKTLSESIEDSSANNDMTLLQNEGKKFLCGVWSIFNHVLAVQNLFNCMAIDPQGWREIRLNAQNGIDNLVHCFQLLDQLDPQTAQGKQLLSFLSRELTRQLWLLRNKKMSIEHVRDNDPFSETRVAHMNLIWSLVIEELFNDAQADCLRVKKEKYDTKYGQKDSISEPGIYMDISKFDAQRSQIKTFQDLKRIELELAKSENRVSIPGVIALEKHPVEKGKDEALEYLFNRLAALGFRDYEAKLFTEGKIVRDALRRVLNNQKLSIDTQPIVASLNGVTGCYEMETTYVEEWVSSADINAEGIPRNFKVHRLYKMEEDGQKVLMRIIIGHGVIDGWGEKEVQKRTNSNTEAAFKVVRKAIESNPRVIKLCEAGHNPKITHVSLLLVTPTSLTQIPLEKTANHREKDYTKGQFAAFDKVNEQGYIKFKGSQPEVKVITFGFGINKLSTGEHNSKVTGGWSNVKEHNREAMEILLGECNRGKRPGGLIGEVMDEVERSMRIDPPHKEAFFLKLLQQIDTVLQIYLEDAYKYSNGDPAKLNREIEALLNTANDALAAVDSKRVITISKGCKSDKDRGGVLITEIFTNAIVEDLGGTIIHNEKLDDEKKNIYLNVATSQFHIQTANTGLPGNKAVGWAVSDEEQAFLRGLSSFAKE